MRVTSLVQNCLCVTRVFKETKGKQRSAWKLILPPTSLSLHLADSSSSFSAHLSSLVSSLNLTDGEAYILTFAPPRTPFLSTIYLIHVSKMS